MDNNFGNKLNNLKNERGLSSIELARKARISAGLLSGLIHDQRIIGEYSANKIGKALQLTGHDLEEFVYAAINNSAEKVLNSSKAFPSQVLNMVAGELNVLGIAPETIVRCNHHQVDGTELHLADGRKATIKLEIACC